MCDEKPQVEIASSIIVVLSATIENQALKIALHTIFKVSTKLRLDFRGKKCLVYELGYTEESVKPRSDMNGSTVPTNEPKHRVRHVNLKRDVKITIF